MSIDRLIAAADAARLSNLTPTERKGADKMAEALRAVATDEILGSVKAQAIRELDERITKSAKLATEAMEKIGAIQSSTDLLEPRAAQAAMLARQLMDIFMANDVENALRSYDKRQYVTVTRSGDVAMQAVKATSYIVWAYLQGETFPEDVKDVPKSGGSL